MISGLSVGAIYALIALGFVIIFKATGILNFAQGMLVVMGAYFCYTTMVIFGLPVWLGLLVAMILGALLGYLLQRFALRPIIGQPVLSMVIMTLVLFALLQGLSIFTWSAELHSLPPALPRGILDIGGITMSKQSLSSAGIAIGTFILCWAYFRYTRGGFAMRIAAEDHEAAQSVGISLPGVFSTVWIIASMIAVVAGFVLGVSAGVGSELSVLAMKSLAVMLLGGLESIPGAIIAGLIVGVIESIVGGYVDPYIASAGIIGGSIREVIPYVILLLVLIIKPYGLFGLKRIERV